MYYGEKLNSISHLVGGVFALIGLGALLTVAVGTGSPSTIVAFTVFGLTLVLLYTMSTLYHSFPASPQKRLFKLLDHIAIYLLIAGTYTPFMLVTLGTESAVVLLAIVWGIGVIGILSEIFLSGRVVKVLQMVTYLGMGWACSLEIDSLRSALAPAGFSWLVTGGVAYTAGILFYVLDKMGKLDHAHGIWHGFVLLGSVAHFIAVLAYVR